MASYGYIRVSSTNQNEDRQLLVMRGMEIPEERIFADKMTGSSFERPAWRALLRKLRPGDIVYIVSIDRLGRNYEEIQNQWRILTKERSVDIVVIDMPLLDTRLNKDLMGTFIADLVLQILSFVAHNERDSIRARQAQGIAAAQARGVKFGRPVKKPDGDFCKVVLRYERGELDLANALKKTGLTQATFFRRLREHRTKRQGKRMNARGAQTL